MSERERDQAAAAAVGGLSEEEAARLEEEVARNPALAAQLDEFRATVATLETGVARERPPADLFDRVLERIETEPAAAPAPERPRARTRRLWPALAAAAATAAAAVALVLALSGGDALGPADASAAVSGTEEFAAVHGEARLHAPSAEDGRLVLELADVPPPPAGEHYEVWVLRSDADAMEAVGVFSPTDDSVELEFRLPGPGDYAAVDVSVEPDGGPAEHSGQSLAGGRFS